MVMPTLMRFFPGIFPSSREICGLSDPQKGPPQGQQSAKEGERQRGPDDRHHRNHAVSRQEAEQQDPECGNCHLHETQQPEAAPAIR